MAKNSNSPCAAATFPGVSSGNPRCAFSVAQTGGSALLPARGVFTQAFPWRGGPGEQQKNQTAAPNPSVSQGQGPGASASSPLAWAEGKVLALQGTAAPLLWLGKQICTLPFEGVPLKKKQKNPKNIW